MMTMKARCGRTGLAVVASMLSSGAWAADAGSWQVSRGDVRVVCPMTIGGSFEARTRSLGGTVTVSGGSPAVLQGSFSVDLATLETGIALRDGHLREKYLEVGKGAGYDKAVLTDVRLEGVDSSTFHGRARFTGTLTVHGTPRPVAGEAQIERQGPSVRVEASFPVKLTDYAIASPRYLGVGVKDDVQVKVSLIAGPASASAPRD